MMSPLWLVGGMALLGFAGGFFLGRVCYLLGVQDGAFHHHLPVVRREMLRFNKARAQEIFEDEDGAVNPVTFRSTFNGG